MHCQVPGIDYSLSKLAIHAALESATAIALSHTGILYIAETDEKKINRVRQVRALALNEFVSYLSVGWQSQQHSWPDRVGVSFFFLEDILRLSQIYRYYIQFRHFYSVFITQSDFLLWVLHFFSTSLH